ncbi:MAG: hypothetical protein ACRDID_01100 [Ktedonobacterales bacterium]
MLLSLQFRLLNWWLFTLTTLGFLAAGALVALQLRIGGPLGESNAAALSRFTLEPGAGLLAGMLASSLLVGDPLLEVTMATRAGIGAVTLWRVLLSIALLLLCSAGFLAWTLAHDVRYAQQQSALYLLLLWLVPVLLLGSLGLCGSLLTGSSTLGMVIAAIPLAGSLLLFPKLITMPASHPFLITYSASGAQDARDWWINRLVLLGFAAVFALWSWRLLRREERLLRAGQ